jgi:hypothetical protein
VSGKKDSETTAVGGTGLDFRIGGGRLSFGEAVLEGVDGALSLRKEKSVRRK